MLAPERSSPVLKIEPASETPEKRGNLNWRQIVQLACELIACDPDARIRRTSTRRWEPKELGLRLLSTAGRLAHHARNLVLHLAADRAWTELILADRTAITTAGPGPRPR